MPESPPSRPVHNAWGHALHNNRNSAMLNRRSTLLQFGTEKRDPTQGHVVPNRFRDLLTVVIGEFCGTFLFLLLSYIGAQTAVETNGPGALKPYSLMSIAASFGTALAVNVWIFYRVSGGMFNPAVTIGLVLVGAVKPLRALYIIPTQFIAGIAAAAVTHALIPGPLLVRNMLADDVSPVRGLFMEMFLTSQLVLAVYFLAVEKHRATFLAPIGIGIALFICHMCGTNYTGTGVNPARSLGPCVVSGFPSYHWIYWIGPLLGALLSYGVYKTFTWLEYRTANPGQDADDLEAANKEAAEAPGTPGPKGGKSIRAVVSPASPGSPNERSEAPRTPDVAPPTAMPA